MDKAIRGNPTYAPLLSVLGGQTLVQAHATWMAGLVQDANNKAHSSLVNWVSTVKSTMPTNDARYPWVEKVGKNVDSAAPPITRKWLSSSPLARTTTANMRVYRCLETLLSPGTRLHPKSLGDKYTGEAFVPDYP
jgi:hypothetical protein